MNAKLVSRGLIGTRIFLAAVFVMYGSIKLFGGQYYYGDWAMTKQTASGTGMVWAFFGYSPVYGRFTGLFELVPALMLLHPRTATLGAAALFAVRLNITVMDFAFDFPMVKYFVLGYTLLALVLVWHDRNRLRLMLLRPVEVVSLLSALDASGAPPRSEPAPGRRA
ncbi:hypothetical protein GCM10023321_04120 [Pseudonocardia eucalypti]|uniref:DoxX family protein n=1 Tax=Pseudonocardia eucalypti TaxID=648755 RepID=A0ABP9PHA8_9PSEU|nr:putative membrane protein YphA (DoxX/SURF4 family) [Pseudonocardia eucalypti]